MNLQMPPVPARAAIPCLEPFVIGFVERPADRDPIARVHLPFAVPVVQVALGEGLGSAVTFSRGSATAHRGVTQAGRAVFIIALSFTGAATMLPELAPGSLGRSIDLHGLFWSSLHDRLSTAPSFDCRVAIAQTMLARHLLSTFRPTSPFLRAGDAIIRDRWAGPVAALADTIGVQERTLRNRFRSELGWAPKKLLGVSRFIRVLRALHPRSWAGARSEDVWLEYADQSHLHHDFVSYSGITPTRYATQKRISGDATLHVIISDDQASCGV